MILLDSKKRLMTLLIVLVCGIIIFILGLGTTGLVDETPPLFAAAARAMSESGDWLTPKVNGMFRFCLLYTSPSPRDYAASRMPSSA